MTKLFQDKLVVVTGGTGVLGAAIARHILDQGGRVAIPAYDEADAGSSEFNGHDRAVIAHAGDLADQANVEAFFEEHAAGVWASIHAAGGFAFSPIEEADADLFEQQLRMNAMTSYLCCRAAIACMRSGVDGARGDDVGGRIVNVAAKPALHPHEGAKMAAYTASKAAVAGLTGALAEEVKADGIWVNAVVPSIMDTPTNREQMPNADHSAWPSVAEVAQTACWLASPANAVTRGALVPVYGRS
ncbi:MAG: SDR family NAD(P)-dependent oxidoreductase [Planctomycetota bacterium]